jgi:hypothetical protein
MKRMRILILLTFVLVLVFSTITASAAKTYLDEDFESYDTGSYPASFTAFAPGAFQEVISSDSSQKFLVGNDSAGFYTDHRADFKIDKNVSKLTLDFKVQPNVFGFSEVTGPYMVPIAFEHNTTAVQVFFSMGAIFASAGQEDFQVVGMYDPSMWYHVVFTVDMAKETYDLTIDDVLVADDFSASIQDLPAHLLTAVVGPDATATFDDVLIYGTHGKGADRYKDKDKDKKVKNNPKWFGNQ